MRGSRMCWASLPWRRSTLTGARAAADLPTTTSAREALRTSARAREDRGTAEATWKRLAEEVVMDYARFPGGSRRLGSSVPDLVDLSPIIAALPWL